HARRRPQLGDQRVPRAVIRIDHDRRELRRHACPPGLALRSIRSATLADRTRRPSLARTLRYRTRLRLYVKLMPPPPFAATHGSPGARTLRKRPTTVAWPCTCSMKNAATLVTMSVFLPDWNQWRGSHSGS